MKMKLKIYTTKVVLFRFGCTRQLSTRQPQPQAASTSQTNGKQKNRASPQGSTVFLLCVIFNEAIKWLQRPRLSKLNRRFRTPGK